MAITSLRKTMARIKKAERNSPITVFVRETVEKNRTVRRLESRFAKTIDANSRIDELVVYQAPGHTPVIEHKYEWLGNFTKHNNVKAVKALLIQAIVERRK